jgi:hypothetical protein
VTFNHKNLRIIKVSNDKNGHFMKLEITLSDGIAIIRWGLDDFTFKKIKEIVAGITLTVSKRNITMSCCL